MKYYWISDTTYVASGVNCLYSTLLCSLQCICITQKPHDHLYKKSGQCQVLYKTVLNVRIFETNEVLLDQWFPVGGVNSLYSSLLCLCQCICIKQKPHNHLYKKSGQWGYSQVLYKTVLNVRIFETNEVLLDQWHQIRCQ